MAFIITAPRNLFLRLLFIVLVIILAPFALFFSLVRLPFARRRINRLPEILRDDWVPRKKYIYIGFSTDNSQLSDFLKKKILGTHEKYIVWDEWDNTQNVWRSSEPDDMRRVTTFWQDIGGDFDGDPMIIIATYSPNDFAISSDHNFHQFWLQNDSHMAMYGGKELTIKETEEEIQKIVNHAIDGWVGK